MKIRKTKNKLPEFVTIFIIFSLAFVFAVLPMYMHFIFKTPISEIKINETLKTK